MQTIVGSSKVCAPVALAVVLVACAVNVDPAPEVHPDAALLVAHGWVITSIKQDSVNKTTDLFATYTLCSRDDVYTFSNDGTYTITGSTTRCHPDDADLRLSSTWRWEAGILRLQPDEPNEVAFSVSKITDKELVMQQIHTANGQVTSVVTWRFRSTPRV